ncbi:hypothetical protein QL285_089135 [Trifolium repens]|nr:hypothetical protein QL285_089135 [Trifolium repens]
MANSGIYVRKTKISEICGGKIDFQLQVRVINLWTTPDRANPTKEGAIHMIFLDEMRGRIHATVRKDLIQHFRDQIEEGCAYVFERFMVAKNDPTFKSTQHKHKLNFMRGTKVYKVTSNEISKNHFEFMPFQDILSCTAEGCLLGRIYTLCKLKKYLGLMGISNSFYGSKLFLNAEVPEVAHYIERMNVANVELTQVVSQLTGPPVISIADDLLQTQRMTIEDLIESTEKCCGSILAWACEFDTDSSWFYQACTKCASRINFVGGQLYCDKCKMPRTAVPR